MDNIFLLNTRVNLLLSPTSSQHSTLVLKWLDASDDIVQTCKGDEF